MNILENFSNMEIPILGECSKVIEKMIQKYNLDQKMRKRNNISKYMWEIIVELSKKDLFENIDKIKLYDSLYSKIDILEPYEIPKEELYNRIRKIMAVEAMSKIFDGLSPEQVDKLSRSFR